MQAYEFLFSLVAIADALLGVSSLVRNKNKYSRYIAWIMFLSMGVTIFYLYAIINSDYQLSSLFSSLYFISIDFLLFVLLLFSFNFTYEDRRGGSLIVKIFFGAVCVDTLVLVTNPFKEVALTYYRVWLTDSWSIFRYIPYLPFHLHLGLCYLMILIIIGVFIRKSLVVPRMYVRRYVRIMFSIIAVVFLNVLYLLENQLFRLDLSILTYSIAGVLIYRSVFYYSEQELLSSSREMLIRNIGIPIAFFDYEGKLVDCNPDMMEILPELSVPSDDFGVLSLLIERYHFPMKIDEDAKFEWYSNDKAGHTYEVQYTGITDQNKIIAGHTLIMNDITYLRDPLTGLETEASFYRKTIELNLHAQYPAQFLIINVNSLGTINQALGHEKGNQVMLATMRHIRNEVGDVYMAKLEDGSFAVIMYDTTSGEAIKKANAIRSAIAEDTSLGFRFEIEYGIAEINRTDKDAVKILKEALDSMKNKKMLSEHSSRNALIQSLTQSLLESDYETQAHVTRTRRESAKLGRYLGLTDLNIGRLALLSSLHDIGKIGIPSHILLKPGKLTDEEWEIMKTHTDKGYRIVNASPELAPIAELVLHHHERWDGLGYPSGLKGEEIPLLDRIITIIDSYDVMVHDRPYHTAISKEEAIAELKRCSGTQFDPKLVEAYLVVLREDDANQHSNR